MKYKKVTIEVHEIGGDKEYFLIVDKEKEQEREWLIGRKIEVEEIIEKLRKL